MHRQPGPSLVIVAMLAVVIGANTAVFSVLDVVLLQPLPYAAADRLVRVETENVPLKISGGPASYPDFVDWRAADLFEAIGIYQLGNSVIRIGNVTERVRSAAASASLFSTLGVQPIIGRLPSPAEDRPGKQPAQDWLLSLRRRRKAVILVHHSNRQGRARWTHKPEDVMDLLVKLSRPDGYTAIKPRGPSWSSTSSASLWRRRGSLHGQLAA